MNELFGRMARKWWLMLVIGVVVGLGIGIPAGGNVLLGELSGVTIHYTAFKIPEDAGKTFSLKQSEYITIRCPAEHRYEWAVSSSNFGVLHELPEKYKYADGIEYVRFQARSPGNAQIEAWSSVGRGTYRINFTVK